MSDTQRFVMTILMAAWALSFAYAFFSFATTPPTGDGFVRGLNRVTAYLGWQGIAAMLAIAVFAVGRQWPKASGVRRLSRIPLGLALLHVAGILALLGWANFG